MLRLSHPGPTAAARALACVCVLALSGCGGSSGSGAASMPSAGSFAGLGPGLAVLVSWKRSGDLLAGSMQRGLLAGDGLEAVRQQTFPITGSVDGSTVTLSLQLARSVTHLSGALVGSTELDLNYPVATQYAAVRLHAGGSAAYAAAVAALAAQAAARNAARRAASHAHRERAHDTKLAELVSGDLFSVDAELGQASDGGASAALGSVRTDLSLVRAAGAHVTAEATSAQPARLCDDANTVSLDANRVDAAQAIVEGDEEGALQDASLIQSSAQQLEQDATTLQGERAAVPSYVPSSAPSAGGVSAAVTTATDTAAGISASAASALAVAQGLFASAEREAKQARAACLKAAANG